jgi:hypothetical protein
MEFLCKPCFTILVIILILIVVVNLFNRRERERIVSTVGGSMPQSAEDYEDEYDNDSFIIQPAGNIPEKNIIVDEVSLKEFMGDQIKPALDEFKNKSIQISSNVIRYLS